MSSTSKPIRWLIADRKADSIRYYAIEIIVIQNLNNERAPGQDRNDSSYARRVAKQFIGIIQAGKRRKYPLTDHTYDVQN